MGVRQGWRTPMPRRGLRARPAVFLVAHHVALLVALVVALPLLVGGAGLLVMLDPVPVVVAAAVRGDPAHGGIVVTLGGLILVDVGVDPRGLEVTIARLPLLRLGVSRLFARRRVRRESIDPDVDED